MSVYRTLSAPVPLRSGLTWRRRLVAALCPGWQTARRWAGGRWRFGAGVPDHPDADVVRDLVIAKYGSDSMRAYRLALDPRWHPASACPHGSFTAPAWPDGREALLWCVCDCEVWP